VRPRRRNAFTLFEVLVASALLLMVLGLVAGIVMYGLRAWGHSTEQSDAQNAVLAVVVRLREDLRTALPASVTVLTGTTPDVNGGPPLETDALTFASSRGPTDLLAFTGSGELEYQKREIFYLQNGALKLQQSFFTATPQPSPMRMVNYAPAPTDRTLAPNIRQLSLQWMSPRLAVTVEARVNGISSRLQTSVAPLSGAAAASPSPSPSSSP
jgi:type II secretory pathway pseudopilin PulG